MNTSDSLESACNALLRPASRATYFKGISFSVFEEAARQLDQAGWSPQSELRAAQADLLLCDRNSVPYTDLRCTPVAPDSFFHGTRWVHYYRGSSELTRKATMALLLKSADTTSSEWMPESYVLSSQPDKKPDEREALLAAAAADESAVWILKPSSGSKGQHIELVRGAAALREFVSSALRPTGRLSSYAVQRYIERPLLISQGRKFDIRVWVLLRRPYSIYAFSQGSCRTASEPFSMDNIAEPLRHLTNHCLQTNADHYGAYEEGNEMWFPQLQAYLTEARGEPEDVLERLVLPRIANIIVRTLLAVKPALEQLPDDPYSSFQLLGYDVLVEEGYTVQLLEINGSPGVAERYLGAIVHSMLRELVRASAEAASQTGAVSAPDNHTAQRLPAPSRTWHIDREELVLLWQAGDAVPEGLTCV